MMVLRTHPHTCFGVQTAPCTPAPLCTRPPAQFFCISETTPATLRTTDACKELRLAMTRARVLQPMFSKRWLLLCIVWELQLCKLHSQQRYCARAATSTNMLAMHACDLYMSGTAILAEPTAWVACAGSS